MILKLLGVKKDWTKWKSKREDREKKRA